MKVQTLRTLPWSGKKTCMKKTFLSCLNSRINGTCPNFTGGGQEFDTCDKNQRNCWGILCIFTACAACLVGTLELWPGCNRMIKSIRRHCGGLWAQLRAFWSSGAAAPLKWMTMIQNKNKTLFASLFCCLTSSSRHILHQMENKRQARGATTERHKTVLGLRRSAKIIIVIIIKTDKNEMWETQAWISLFSNVPSFKQKSSKQTTFWS